MTKKNIDVTIIGSGPNGLAAGIELLKQGASVHIYECHHEVGGGLRSEELTLAGFNHDFCSGVHPMGVLSPYFSELPLDKYGLEWVYPEASVAHPLDNEPAVMLYKSIEQTIEGLGKDAKKWKQLLTPFVENGHQLLKDSLGPLSIPENPLLLAQFGLKAMRSAESLAKSHFKSTRAQALFSGCAAHSVLPLDKYFSAAVGLMFAITGHMVNWPVVKGGTKNLASALAGYFTDLGGKITLSQKVNTLDELPESKFYLFDTDPVQLAKICKDRLPDQFRKKLEKYNFGPGAFKMDWALSESIPWKDIDCLKASTVHIGGTLEEIALSEKSAWEGIIADKPFVLLCQQSEFDRSRSPEGKHTGYAYCHVPNGCEENMSSRIEDQVERFAPGFKDIILDRKSITPAQFQNYNPNYFGGAVTGGAADITQLFTRPSIRLDPYSTPNPSIFICSASSPPGGGVHGMCGYHAAQSILKHWSKKG